MTTLDQNVIVEKLGGIVKESVQNEVVKAVDDAMAKVNHTIEQKLHRAAEVTKRDTGDGREVGTICRLLQKAGQTGMSARDLARQENVSDSVMKSFGTELSPLGGFFVPEDVMATLIPSLLPQVSVLRSGVRQVRMGNGNMSFLMRNSKPRGTYGPSCRPIECESMDINKKNMIARKLMAGFGVCNDLFKFTNDSGFVDQFIRDEFLIGLSQTMDQYLLKGNGSEDTPTGLINLAANNLVRSYDAAAVAASNVAGPVAQYITIETVKRDLLRMIAAIRSQDVPMRKGAWFMTPDVYYFIQSFVTGIGLDVEFARELGASDRLFGMPVYVTNNLPKNLAAPTIADANDPVNYYNVGVYDYLWSQIVLADMDSIIFGEAYGISVDRSSDANADFGCGPMGWSTDDTLYRAMASHNLISLYNGKDIAVLNVDWSL